MAKRQTGLDTLLDRHGEILVQDGKGFAGRRLEYDHVHRHAKDKGVAYAFSSAGQLLTDFFNEVDRVLKELL